MSKFEVGDKIKQEQLAKKEADEWLDKIAKLKIEFDNFIFKMPDFNEMFKSLDTYHGLGNYVTFDFLGVFEEREFSPSKNDFNSFRTKEAAEEARKHLQITCSLLNFRAENDKDYNIKKYFGYFLNLKDNCIDRFHPNFIPAGIIFFSSEELAQAALDMLKRKGLI